MQARAVPSFPIYLTGLSAWFFANGIQTVLYPWLAAIVLGLPAAMVGIAQMMLMGPAILLMLYAGVIADRGDPRRILMTMHLLAMVPALALAGAVYLEHLSLPLLLVYGAAMGCVQAFAVPSRDSLLQQVVPHGLAKAVAIATGLQFASQLVGIGAAYLADRIGAPPLLLLQAAIVGLGALAVTNLPRPAVRAGTHEVGRFGAMLAGLRAARADARVWPVLSIMVAIGIFYGGTFMVTIPIAVRDVYGSGADGIAMTNFAFWMGTILVSFAMAGVATRVRRPGAMLIGACTYGVVVLMLIGSLPSWPFMLGLCFAWGLGAGVTMTQGRTIVQLLAAAEMRGRMLALFQLGFLGGGPIGALLMGAVTQIAGPSIAMWIAAGCMTTILLLLVLRSSILRFDPAAPPSSAAITEPS